MHALTLVVILMVVPFLARCKLGAVSDQRYLIVWHFPNVDIFVLYWAASSQRDSNFNYWKKQSFLGVWTLLLCALLWIGRVQTCIKKCNGRFRIVRHSCVFVFCLKYLQKITCNTTPIDYMLHPHICTPSLLTVTLLKRVWNRPGS